MLLLLQLLPLLFQQRVVALCMPLPSCAPTDTTSRLGALGILSASDQPKFRHAARRSWLAGQVDRERAGGLAVRFVVRGRDAPAALHQEAQAERDVLLLDAPALDRRSGPLVSMLLWFDCALATWPTATLVGKADDDVWIHLPGVELHLRLTLAALRNQTGGHTPLLSWGVQETYSWDTAEHLPWGFAYLYGWDRVGEHEPCTRQRRSRRIGPFHFARCAQGAERDCSAAAAPAA